MNHIIPPIAKNLAGLFYFLSFIIISEKYPE